MEFSLSTMVRSLPFAHLAGMGARTHAAGGAKRAEDDESDPPAERDREDGAQANASADDSGDDNEQRDDDQDAEADSDRAPVDDDAPNIDGKRSGKAKRARAEDDDSDDADSDEEMHGRTPAHDLTGILMVALCAILCGADSWVAIQAWGEEKLDWLRRHIPLEQGIPSHDTFGRVFAALDPKQFEACFIRWMSGLCPALAGQVVAIDGKTVRGSHQRGERAIHLVSAYGSGLGAVLGQVRTADKSNEITAIPELLDALLLKGAIITIDAMGCQQAIARQIVKAGADYVLNCLAGKTFSPQPRLPDFVK